MDDGIAAHLRRTALTRLALFSVTNTANGAIATTGRGYELITGSLGSQLIREAHARGVRVDIVFTSFGENRNARFFADLKRQDRTIAALVRLADRLHADGINVDVERLDPALVPAYGAFVGKLRAAIRAADRKDRVTATTWGSITGAAMAAAAADAGADRIFLMGYDYHWADTVPGASSPIRRRDANGGDLLQTLDRYALFGVPVERTLLGLPLYGMSWPVAKKTLGASGIGSGVPWILRQHLDVLRNRSIVPERDDIEVVDFYALPRVGPGWRAVYVDSPATLRAKLALANERGFAGAGFWAIGYERGLPRYTKLIARFAGGKPMK
jgi:spore germination protein YaaH